MLIGLGQNCPSMEQLQGVIDCTDPCQVGSQACPTASTPPTASVPIGNLCVQSSFPWIGTANSAGTCEPLSGAAMGIVALSGFFLVAFFIGGKK